MSKYSNLLNSAVKSIVEVKKEAAINRAEGEKQANILKAELFRKRIIG